MAATTDLLCLHRQVARARLRSAWTEIARLLFGDLVAALRRKYPRVRDLDLFADAVTTALEQYWSAPECYRRERGSLPAYLGCIAKSRLLDTLAKTAGRCRGVFSPENTVSFGADKHPEPYIEVERTELEGVTREILESLFGEDRVFVVLYLTGERDPEEFAKILGFADRSPEEKKTAVRRARDRIFRKLKTVGKKFSGAYAPELCSKSLVLMTGLAQSF